jgi:hypothetical protein
MNCGECGFPCADTLSCNMGTCGCAAFGDVLCVPDGGTGFADGGDAVCTNIGLPRNCGGCGVDCTVQFGEDAGCRFGTCE